eukprot:TRINITY_DN24252_c0_g1_i1.p1 TRINITY_DN24252_c0_g1~~TRINITY_DN24252_c0_g1_i1.p1  ORF type:complete len:297 (-),score=52.22 TRINITY_DN24252_c0_g1_i1:117-1007(-)
MSLEPIFHCLASSEVLFTQTCPEGQQSMEPYSAASMSAMLCYWILVIDFSVFATRISAFVLVCGSVLGEVCLFLTAVVFLTVSFASSIAALAHDVSDFDGMQNSALRLLQVALGMYRTDDWEEVRGEAVLLLWVFLFLITVVIFLMNLLTAQLHTAYEAIYIDMVGYARLNRGRVTCQMLQGVSKKPWEKFVEGLAFDECLEFNEGDIGLPGGVQLLEASNLNPTTKDAIIRVGGSNPGLPWPQEVAQDDDEDENKYDRLEKMLTKAAKGFVPGEGGGKKKAGADGESMASDDSDE